MTALAVKKVDGNTQKPCQVSAKKRESTGVMVGRTFAVTKNHTSTKITKTAEKATVSSSSSQDLTPLEKHLLHFTRNVRPIEEEEELPVRPFIAPQKSPHKYESGLSQPVDNIKKEALDTILNYAQPGKNFLSELDINRMISDFKKRDKDKSLSILKSTETEQAFKLLLELCCDHWEKIDGQYVRCLTKETISLFYTDLDTLFERVENKELPIPQPIA